MLVRGDGIVENSVSLVFWLMIIIIIINISIIN
jgi:hypothetical protein